MSIRDESMRIITRPEVIRRAQDCADCVEAFTRQPVAGKWELGENTTPIRYHWTTPGELDVKRARGICGARVIINKKENDNGL